MKTCGAFQKQAAGNSVKFTCFDTFYNSCLWENIWKYK